MFKEAHKTLEGLRKVFDGQASTAEEERLAVHLMGCRACRLLSTRAIAAQKATGTIAVQGSLRLLLDLQEKEQAKAEEWLEAQATWAEIRSLNTKARRDKVRLTRSLHTMSFLEVLLEEGATATPVESEELFYLALLAAGQLPYSIELKNDLCAECCSEIANARRRQAKWPGARDALKKGKDYAARGSGDRVVEGKVLTIEGILEDDLGNCEEAAKILRRAVGLFEMAADTFLASKTLARLAFILVDLDPAESLRVAERALALIPADNPRLVMFTEGIRVNCLLTIGAPQEALLRFMDLKKLQEQFREPVIQLKRRFTEARILEHLGRMQKAESLFQEVIAGDLEYGLTKDFYLDLVYLFGFYLRTGKSSEAIAVCQQAHQELALVEDEEGSAEPARDQMRLVWRNLEEEVKKGTVDLGAPNVLRNYIKAHWRTPANDPPSFRARSGDAV
jgi:tetratricopeptide (TPR) repeat protein